MRAKPLTESEKITMKCVWDIGDGARLSRIMTLANDKYGKEWKPQTVSTFLGKLVRKGFVEQYISKLSSSQNSTSSRIIWVRYVCLSIRMR